MSAIDWPAMLAQLEQQRIALEQERQDIDAVIDTVRRRAGVAVPAGLTLPPARATKTATDGKRAAAASAKTSRGVKTERAVLARIRAQYEKGVPVAQIPEGRGHGSNWVYQLASDGGWKRPRVPAPKAKVEPKGTQLSGSVRCDHCQTMTDYDPCRACGKTLTRKW